MQGERLNTHNNTKQREFCSKISLLGLRESCKNRIRAAKLFFEKTGTIASGFALKMPSKHSKNRKECFLFNKFSLLYTFIQETGPIRS